MQLAPIPQNIELSAEEREALSREEGYSRKGAFPTRMVSRQQFIEDILACGFTDLSVSKDKRNGRVVAVTVARGEGQARQFYTLNRKHEVAYLQRRHAEVVAAAAAKTTAPIAPSDGHGWTYGEEVSQQFTARDGKTYHVEGIVIVNSAQRWRIKLTDPAGAPGLRSGQTFPATASWRRKAAKAADVPVATPVAPAAVLAPAAPEATVPPPALAAQQREVPPEPALPQAPQPSPMVEPAKTLPAIVGSEVFRVTDRGTVFGKVFQVKSPGGDGELRVRVLSAEGTAGQQYPRGATRPYSPEWKARTPEAAVASVPTPELAPASATTDTNLPALHFQVDAPKPAEDGSLPTMRGILGQAILAEPTVAGAIDRGEDTQARDLIVAALPRALHALGATASRWLVRPPEGEPGWIAQLGMLARGSKANLADDILAEAVAAREAARQAKATKQAEARAEAGLSEAETPEAVAPWIPVNPVALFRRDLAEDGSARWTPVQGELIADLPDLPAVPARHFALVPDANPARSSWVSIIETTTGSVICGGPTVADAEAALYRSVRWGNPAVLIASLTRAEATYGLAPSAGASAPAQADPEQAVAEPAIPTEPTVPAPPAMQSFAAELSTDGGRTFGRNSMRFATEAEAIRHAKEIMDRWWAATDFRVTPAAEAPNAVLDENDRAVSREDAQARAAAKAEQVQPEDVQLLRELGALPASVDRERIERELARTGAAEYSGVRYRIVPAPSAPAAPDPEQAHFVIESVRDGRREYSDPERPMTLADARAYLVADLFTPEPWRLTKEQASELRNKLTQDREAAELRLGLSALLTEYRAKSERLQVADKALERLRTRKRELDDQALRHGVGLVGAQEHQRVNERLAKATADQQKASAEFTDVQERFTAGRKALADAVITGAPLYFRRVTTDPYMVGTEKYSDVMSEHGHRAAVRRALLADAPVPAEVVAGYPELATLAKDAAAPKAWNFTFSDFLGRCQRPSSFEGQEYRTFDFAVRNDNGSPVMLGDAECRMSDLVAAMRAASETNEPEEQKESPWPNLLKNITGMLSRTNSTPAIMAAVVLSLAERAMRDSGVLPAKATPKQVATLAMVDAAYRHHHAAVGEALEAGEAVPAAVAAEYRSVEQAKQPDVPHPNALVEKHAQAMAAGTLAKNAQWDGYTPTPLLKAQQRELLATNRAYFAERLAEIEAKQPKFAEWLNSNNPSTMRFMYEVTGWTDARTTIKNANECWEAWAGAAQEATPPAQSDEAKPAPSSAPAAAAPAPTAPVAAEPAPAVSQAEQGSVPDSAAPAADPMMAELRAMRRRLQVAGSTVPVMLDGVQFIEALVGEGFTVLNAGTTPDRMVLCTPDQAKGMLLRSAAEIAYAKQVLARREQEARPQPAPAEQAKPVSANPPPEASVPVTPAPQTAPAVQSDQAEAVTPKAPRAPRARSEAPAGKTGNLYGEGVKILSQAISFSEPAAQPAATPAAAEMPKDARSAALAAGAIPAPADLAPLALFDRHQGDTTLRMVALRLEGEAVAAFPVADLLAGEPVSAETVPLAEITVPADRPAFTRPPAQFRGWLGRLAGTTLASIPPEDDVAERIAALAQAAAKGQDSEVAAILGEPAVGLALGEAAPLFAAEAAAIAALAAEVKLAPEQRNFYYGRDEQLAPRTTVARLKANIAAVKLLAELREEGRLASPEEKATLAAFSGWGSFKAIFNDEAARAWETVSEHHARTGGKLEWTEYKDGEQVKSQFGHQRYTYGGSPGTPRTETIPDLKTWVERIIELGAKPYLSYQDAFTFTPDKRPERGHRSDQYLKMPTVKALLNWATSWGRYRDELVATFTEDEMQYAAVSSLNAHYTDEGICHRLWDIAEKAGFKGGVVLEPAVGSGRIISAMPPELREKCKVIAVEKDTFSANLAAALLPEAKVWPEPFEHAPIKPHTVDLVITNVPFDDMTIGDSGLNLHNFFIQHSMEKLKPGGLAVVITTANSLDKSPEQRAKLATAGVQLFEAVRLPNDAFKGAAGTEVVTDILVLRKPAQHLSASTETFRSTLPVEVPEEQRRAIPESLLEQDKTLKPIGHALINEYYVRHPERVLGTHSLLGKMYGPGNPLDPQYTLMPAAGAPALLERLDAAIATIQPIANSSTPAPAHDDLDEAQQQALKGDVVGSVVRREGKLWRVGEYREMHALTVAPDAKVSEQERKNAPAMADAYVRLRDTFRELIAADLSPATEAGVSEGLRVKLRTTYEDFRAEYGALNENDKALKAIVGTDPHFYSILALERVEYERRNKRKVKVCTPTAILEKRTLFPSRLPSKAETLTEAVDVSMAEKMRLDVGYIARLLGRDPTEDTAKVAREIVEAGLGFIDPASGECVHRNHYLSGDVLSKLHKATAIAAEDPEFQRNVEALVAVQPRAIPFDELRFDLADPWLPESVVTAFFKTLGLSGELVYNPDEGGWQPATATGRERDWDAFFDSFVNGAREAKANYGIEELHQSVVFRAALCGRVAPIFKEEDGRRRIDEVLTKAVESKVDALVTAFKEWVKKEEHTEHREAMVQRYNASKNRIVQATWDGSDLRLPGLSHYVPMQHQRHAVKRNLSRLRGMIGHGVGFGKTLEIIITAYEAKRMGLVHKPMIVCDAANYEQIVAEAHRCYPAARILHGDEGSMSPANREGFKTQIVAGDYDLILVSREQFGLMRLSPEREIAYMKAKLEELGVEDGASPSKARAQSKRKAKELQEVLEKLEELKAKGVGITFEEMGVDLLEVDESHRHKNIGLKTDFDVKGIDTSESARGRGLLLKADYLHEVHGHGRGVIGFTGTPVSNTNAELYTACKIFDPQALTDFDINTFDEFIKTFCQTTNELELNEANGRWRYVERLAKYKNFREFQRWIAEFADIRLDPTELGIKRPSYEKGGIELATCPLSHPVWVGQQAIGDIYETWEKLVEEANEGNNGRKPKEAVQEKREMAWISLALMGLNTALAIDPRLVDPNAKVGKDALVYGIADNIAAIYHEKNRVKKAGEITHTQVVFCDRIQSGLDRMFELDLNAKKLDGEAIYEAAREKFLLKHGLEEEEKPKKPARADSEEEDDDEEVALTAQVKGRGKAAQPEPEEAQRFNLWEELRKALVERGIPRDQIALVSDAKNKAERLEMYDKMNSGELAILIASRARVGVGANFQKRLYAAHDFDPPRSMTPDSQEQAHGRILRQGNNHEAIRIFCYGMSDTVIPAMYGRINYKGAMARQAYAKPGDQLEFEESKDLGAEAMRASLLTDTRARDLALIETERRELMVQLDAQDAMLHSLRGRVRQSEANVASYARSAARAGQVSDWFAANAPKIVDLSQWNISIKFHKNLGPWEEAIIKKHNLERAEDGTVLLKGNPEEVSKVLEKFFDNWKEDEEARHLCQMNFNGLALVLHMAQRATLTGKREYEMEARFYDPVDTSVDNAGQRKLYHTFSFRTPVSFTNGVRLMVADADCIAVRERAYLDGQTKQLAADQAALDKGLKLDASEVRRQIAQLEAKASELKKDMQDRPFAGKIPQPQASKKCELTITIPSIEAKAEVEAKRAKAAKGAALSPSPEPTVATAAAASRKF